MAGIFVGKRFDHPDGLMVRKNHPAIFFPSGNAGIPLYFQGLADLWNNECTEYSNYLYRLLVMETGFHRHQYGIFSIHFK
ncbi:hypothetical protein D3C86_1766290 [compost metagenome]